MVHFALATAFLALSSVVSASPTPGNDGVNLEKRFNVLSGQWDTENIVCFVLISHRRITLMHLQGNGQYILYNNLFGAKDPGTSGSQTTQAVSYSGTTIRWGTKYSWSGNPGNVKSYANVALQKGLNKKVNAIKSIPTSWQWTYSAASGGLVADVAYDLWLSNVPNSGTASKDSTVEIMIWLSNRRAGPAGSQIATANVGGVNWKLFKGTVGTWTVYSFVAPSELTNFKTDLKPFFTYLGSAQKLNLNQYLVALQAGTEPFIGMYKSASAYCCSG
ncbi:unnamed protein product [Rhizoctonia solani]|uniref:Glycoside hydrolase family 12 protein n=1 Tax=Rhizoctonia solani TaxID=456999 RepID=A0A8H3AHA4_9AGAM|nr:unnamed protein product [Rhizoctonia solani]CAE7139215.1 unnamed protein product [Rhizoctonia solani]